MRVYDSNGNLINTDILGEVVNLNMLKYRRDITINNTSNPSSLTNYQVLITVDTSTPISAGKMRSDGGDIRFYDGANNLSYWIESGINTSSTKIWVNVPSIPAMSTKVIQMYYGNPNLTSLSNGNNTFLLFDDFLGSSLDTNKWILARPTGTGTYSATVANGYVEIYAASNTAALIVSQISVSFPFAIEGVWKYNTGLENWHAFTQTSGGSDSDWVRVGYSGSYFYYQKRTSGTISTYQSFSRTAPTSWTRISVQITLSSVKYFENGTQVNSTTMQDRYTGGINYPQFMVWNGGTSDYDWIAIRNFTPTEPTITVGSEINLTRILRIK